jgi:hypothetical protein
MWEAGWTGKAISRCLGLHHSTVGRWARAEGWVAPERPQRRRYVPSDDDIEGAERRHAVAHAALKRVWANRRAEVADRIGDVVGHGLDRLREAMDDRDANLIRANAIAVGVLVDKAQLLSGLPTGRFGFQQVNGGSGSEQAIEAPVVDILAAARARADRLRAVEEPRAEEHP